MQIFVNYIPDFTKYQHLIVSECTLITRNGNHNYIFMF